jgi:hypothetical protein
MFNLVEETSRSRLENNLIRSAQIRDSWFSMIFNIVSLSVVLIGFFYFLYASYDPKREEVKSHIEFKSVPWMNAVKNVPSSVQYGQIPQTEIGSSVSGIINRSSASAF